MIDNREGTEEEFRLAVGKPENIIYAPQHLMKNDEARSMSDANIIGETDVKPVTTMLILDAKFGQSSTFVALSVQRPQLLVALDFLLAVVEFFVPAVGDLLSTDEDKDSIHMVDAIILDQPSYHQPDAELSLYPYRPLIVDDERFNHFIYDGKGGVLYLKDRHGHSLSGPSMEALIHIGSGKKLQFKNVVIKVHAHPYMPILSSKNMKNSPLPIICFGLLLYFDQNGLYLDSCILLGANSSYSASKDDGVYLEVVDEDPGEDHLGETFNDLTSQSTPGARSMEYVIELQVPNLQLLLISFLLQ